MKKTIHLSPENYIGKGLHRKCYIHPEDPFKCIKINYNIGADIETNREVKYYKHLLKRQISWECLSKYYGSVDTDLGIGHVYDLIRDDDNSISISLENYLKQSLNAHELNELTTALINLKKALLNDRIITMTIKSKNILYQRRNCGNRLVIIDNIGNSKLIKIDNYCNFLAKKSINRKWQRFIKDIEKENFALVAAYQAKIRE